jgi:hypothetical protein
MWQPKWQQWLVIWVTFVLCFFAVGGSDTTALLPSIISAGALIVWMLQARTARS